MSITPNYYRNCDGIILVYDLNDKDTFNDIEKWMNSINQHTDLDKELLFIGNKADLENIVTKSDIKAIEKKTKIKNFKVSAKKNLDVANAFEYIISNIIKKRNKQSKENANDLSRDSKSFTLNNNENKTNRYLKEELNKELKYKNNGGYCGC